MSITITEGEIRVVVDVKLAARDEDQSVAGFVQALKDNLEGVQLGAYQITDVWEDA